MIQFGLRLHDAEKLPVEQVLPLVRQKGFTCAHVALSKSFKELPCTPSALTPGYALYLRHLFEKNGIDIAVLGNYLNLAHPDADALHAIQEKYYAHIRFASLLGCGMDGSAGKKSLLLLFGQFLLLALNIRTAGRFAQGRIHW